MTQAHADQRTTRGAVVWLIRGLALAAAAVSAYLLVVALGLAGRPIGCGEGSGCSVVLASRWAGTLGVPVGAPALLAYLIAIGASLGLGADRPADLRRRAWSALVVVSCAVVLSAAWFTILQLAVVRAVCPWCLAAHALGLAFAATVWWAAPMPVAPRLPLVGLGALAVGGLVAGQLLVEYSPSALQRLPAGRDADTGPGPHRLIQLLDGELVLRPHEEPILGSPDARHVLAVLIDYCCPHCRTTHGYLLEALERHPGQLAVIVLPMPRDGKCNPSIVETEPRFEEACALARLAMAVHHAEADAFASFDRWLFEPEAPRTAAEARRHAERLVGTDELADALEEAWVARAVRRGVDAYATLGAERIPVMLAVGLEPVVGRPASAEDLLDLLESELLLQAVPP